MRDSRDETGRECERAGRAIEDLGDGRTGRVRSLMLRRHVRECPGCAPRLEKMSAVLEALSEMQREQLPEEFTAAVMARLLDAVAGRPAGGAERGRDNRNLFWVVGAAGLGLVIGLALAVVRHLLGRQGEDELAVAGHA